MEARTVEITLWEFPCDKWTHITHIEDTPSGTDIKVCPGGRARTAKRVAGEALLADEYYWVLSVEGSDV